MNIMAVDFRRSLFTKRFIFITAALIVTLIASTWDMLYPAMLKGGSTYSVVDLLTSALLMDKFKTLMVILLAGIYTHGFCMDQNHHYLRGILTRTMVIDYSISKFVANGVSILLAVVVSFIGYAGVVLFIPGITFSAGTVTTFYYQTAYQSPFLYTLMMALQFGLVCSACSSIGMLLSAFQPDSFISIGCCGMVFFCAASYIPLDSMFNVLGLISMYPTLPSGFDTLQPVMFLWGIFYPCVVTVVCCYLFYKRMKRREANGLI